MMKSPLSPARVAARGALLLDFDGTLVPIADRPDAVTVPRELPSLLACVERRLNGALAIVTGRNLGTLDALLAPTVLPAAGEHGLMLRPDPQRAACPARDIVTPADLARAAQALVDCHPGTILEVKRAGIAVHYRTAPQAADTIRAAMREIAAMHGQFALLFGNMVVELRPRGIDKGTAVRALMQAPPFAGRMPLFVGDDTTDEDGIAAAIALGGQGLRMAESFGTPAALAKWLRAVVEAEDAAAA
jgi:trehalose 6-phosphate phosphatase